MQSSRKVAEALKVEQLSECKGSAGARTAYAKLRNAYSAQEPTQPTPSERMRTDPTTLENFKSDSAPDIAAYLG